MKTVLNITNLVGTIIIIGDNTNEISDRVIKALQQALNQVQGSQELDQGKSLSKSEVLTHLDQDSQ